MTPTKTDLLPDEIWAIASPWNEWADTEEHAKWKSEISCCDAEVKRYVLAQPTADMAGLDEAIKYVTRICDVTPSDDRDIAKVLKAARLYQASQKGVAVSKSPETVRNDDSGSQTVSNRVSGADAEVGIVYDNNWNGKEVWKIFDPEGHPFDFYESSKARAEDYMITESLFGAVYNTREEQLEAAYKAGYKIEQVIPRARLADQKEG